MLGRLKGSDRKVSIHMHLVVSWIFLSPAAVFGNFELLPIR